MSEQRVLCRVYACGGCGLNLGSLVSNGVMTVSYVDTSGANLTDRIPDGSIYRIDGVDGSGRNRRENHATIAKAIPAIMQQFPPGDFNVVLSSASGGSGSVIAPLIVSQLLESKEATAVVLIGADDAAISVTNTINTLKSLESISLMQQQPVVMSYHENTPGVPRGAIDQDVIFVLEALGELTSQTNRELDTRDLINWVQYQKVSPVQPQFSFLHVYGHRQDAAQAIEPISVASLYGDPAKENAFGSPHYNTVGFFADGDSPLGDQLHFVINIADVEENYRRLLQRQTELNRTHSGYRQRKTVVDIDDNLTNDGLVL